jgi:hypothetical protein
LSTAIKKVTRRVAKPKNRTVWYGVSSFEMKKMPRSATPQHRKMRSKRSNPGKGFSGPPSAGTIQICPQGVFCVVDELSIGRSERLTGSIAGKLNGGASRDRDLPERKNPKAPAEAEPASSRGMEWSLTVDTSSHNRKS